MKTFGRHRLRSAGRGLCLAVATLGFLFPFVWMLVISLRQKVDILQPEMLLAPFTLENYRQLFESGEIFPHQRHQIQPCWHQGLDRGGRHQPQHDSVLHRRRGHCAGRAGAKLGLRPSGGFRL